MTDTALRLRCQHLVTHEHGVLDDAVLVIAHAEIIGIEASGSPATEEIAGWVVPGFVDTHVHVTAHGLALTGLDLTGTASREETLQRLREHAAGCDDPVLWGHGWDQTRWADETAPTTAAAAAPASSTV